jgi:hypothetical protein
MHIAIVDCVTTHPTRHLPSSFYTDQIQQSNDKRSSDDEYPFCYDDDSDCERTAFNHFVEKDFGLKEDYCLGRFEDIPKDIGDPFYADQETQNLFEYYNPRVISQKDFEWIINLLRKMIVEQYKEKLYDPHGAMLWRGALEAKIEQWESPYIEPYNIDNTQKCLVRAYDLEYRIFDLVRLYKSIDWCKDTVILFGW